MEHDTGAAQAWQAEDGAGPAVDRAGPAVGRAERDTGNPRVDAALRGLTEIDDLPVAEHPPVFERIHACLVEVLGELHSGPQADLSARGRQPS